MSKYNPRIYNYYNLKEEDKTYINAKAEVISSLEAEQHEYFYIGEPTVLEKMFVETAQEVLNHVKKSLIRDLVEFIVVTIDSYEEDVEEIETSDFFYGMDYYFENPFC